MKALVIANLVGCRLVEMTAIVVPAPSEMLWILEETIIRIYCVASVFARSDSVLLPNAAAPTWWCDVQNQ